MPDNLPAAIHEVPQVPVRERDTDREQARQEIAATGGMWLPGQSGNPAGRPKGSKGKLAELKRELEVAVRDNLNPKVVRGILQRMAEMALAGDVKAAKLILDKLLTNASEGEEESKGTGTFVFQVKNLTLKHEQPAVDAEFTVISPAPQEPQQ